MEGNLPKALVGGGLGFSAGGGGSSYVWAAGSRESFLSRGRREAMPDASPERSAERRVEPLLARSMLIPPSSFSQRSLNEGGEVYRPVRLSARSPKE